MSLSEQPAEARQRSIRLYFSCLESSYGFQNLEWKEFVTTRNIPKAGLLDKLSNQRRKALF